MSLSTTAHAALLAAALTSAALAGTPAPEPKNPPAKNPPVLTEPADDGWKISLWSYGWLAGLEGTTGVAGLKSEVDVPFSKILDHLDMTAAMNLEVQKGRWGGWIDGMYLKVSAGGNTREPLLDNVTVSLEQIAVEAAVFYRVWENERTHVDVYGGARYMRMDGELHLSLSDEGVTDVTRALSARVVGAITREAKARAKDAVAANRDKIAGAVADKADDVLENAGDFADAHPALVQAIKASPRLKEALRRVARARVDEQVGALQSQLADAKAAAKRAVAKAEKALTNELERALRETVPSEVGGTVDWIDPFVGARIRHEFNDTVYLTAKADIGGFGISSDLTWQVYAALGVNLTHTATLELGYKYMAVDYTRGGFTNDVATSGAYLALGLKL